jgi:hypothetical protein
MSTPNLGQPHRVSPAVFRRRRLVVAIGFVAVVIAIILIIVQPGGATPAPSAAPVASPTPSSTTIPTTPPEVVATAEPVVDTSKYAACNPKALTVGAVTDAVDYQAGVLPQLSLTITNTGKEPCVYNVGTSQQVFSITSGAETYWMSSDCQTDVTDLDAVLEPGKTETSAPIQWARERSAAGTCEGAREQVPANGASYYLTTKVGTATSKESRQFLLY